MNVNGVSSLDEHFFALRENVAIKYCINKKNSQYCRSLEIQIPGRLFVTIFE